MELAVKIVSELRHIYSKDELEEMTKVQIQELADSLNYVTVRLSQLKEEMISNFLSEQ